MNICYVGHPVSPVSKPLSPVTYHATAAPCVAVYIESSSSRKIIIKNKIIIYTFQIISRLTHSIYFWASEIFWTPCYLGAHCKREKGKCILVFS